MQVARARLKQAHDEQQFKLTFLVFVQLSTAISNIALVETFISRKFILNTDISHFVDGM